ncbi:MAG: beta-ketoacyl-ACP synthase [Rhodospirillales bacterium]|nr:beta-ketoacyl-ACP synthase [Rhodospirillales bacterium]
MTADTDSQGRPIVVVTGIGVVTSLGQGVADNWGALTAGRSGIRRITRFPVDGLRTTIAGTIDFVKVTEFSTPALSEAIASSAIEEAIGMAAIGAKGAFPGPLFLALPPVELEWPQRRALAAASGCAGGSQGAIGYSDLLRAASGGAFKETYRRFLFASVGETLADRFGTSGVPIEVSTACASGATAIQLGVEAIRRGETEVALSVGTDTSVNVEAVVRFSLLSALSTRNDPPEAAVRPFSKDRDGFVMAEGAGALVLESRAHARARGAAILGVVAGLGEMADSFHRTRSSPDGKPIIACMNRAIADAGLVPDEIGYVNAHGTGTPENDKMEWLGLSAVLGERAGKVPVSSNKSMIGHTLSAAGAIEAVFTLLTLRNGVLPPTINYDIPDPALPIDCVPNLARPADVAAALSNSFGFGGQNVSLVLTREPG